MLRRLISTRRLDGIALMIVLCNMYVIPAFAATYYVDSAAGNDGNSGTSPAGAWNSIAKVNSTTFSSGCLMQIR